MVPLTTTIACLPVAGPQNPYQHLMMAGLNQSGRLKAFSGMDDRFFGIVRTVVKYRPGYLHFDWVVSYYHRRRKWLTYLGVIAFCGQILLARAMGVKLAWTLHNLLPHDLGDPEIHRFCQRFLARRCEWVRVFSVHTVARAARELDVPEGRFRVVPEGDYTSVYPNAVSRAEARNYLGLPQNAKVFLNIGLIKPYKGTLELVKCFEEAQLPNACLLIAGKIMDASYGEQIRQAVSRSGQRLPAGPSAADIFLTDRFIPPAELQYYFNAADAVILPFEKIENSGSAIMAMGFAKPVVAPRRNVLKERLAQQDEWLYDPPEELPGILKKLADAPAEALHEAGSRNFAALRNFSWQDFAPLFP